jgi:hypothetical protein
VTLNAAVFDLSGRLAVRAVGTAMDPVEVGTVVARDLIDRGAAPLLEAASAESAPWRAVSAEAR